MRRSTHIIKPEPGELSSSTRNRSTPSVQSTTQGGTHQYSSAPGSVPSARSHQRYARSGAPSVETAFLPRAGPAASSNGNDEDDPVYMEARTIKQIADSTSMMTTSFISNGLPFQVMGLKLKEINDALGTLQTLGIQHVASLPEIVLVGDQSAGKSSLMSALAGLNLPQSQGTCTRCPIHIRLSRAAEWCCRVSLQLDYAYKPETRSITARDVTRNRPFPPWEKQGREIKDFKTIRDPEESIESILKWAQLAILNPGSSHQHFVPNDYDSQGVSPPNDDEPTQAKFSPNTIALEITGPNLPDLSFYDLPGVFTNPGKAEDEYLVRVVQNLTKEYVARENAIVLWAVPMNADPETSSSFTIIRSIKNADKRVLGVMTKADLLPKSNDHRWLAVLKGHAHATGLGYFITSRPDKHDLQEQEAWEEGFFNGQIETDSPWPESFQEFDDRCGVTKLKDFLSRKLAAEFSKSLPVVKEKVEIRQSEVEASLRELPELPANPEFEIRQSLAKFSELVKVSLQAQSFKKAFKSKKDTFAAHILDLKPIYRVKPAEAANPVVVDLCDDEDAATPSQPPQQGSGRQKRRAEDSTLVQTPSKRRTVKVEETSPSVGFATPTHLAGPNGTPLRPRIGGAIPKRTLSEIRSLISDHRNHAIPDDVPVSVKTQLCLEAIHRWDRPLSTFLTDTMRILHIELTRALDTALANVRQRSVYRDSRKILDEFLNEHGNTYRAQLENLYKLEGFQIYSINPDIFEKNRVAEKRRLVRVRHAHRLARHIGDEPDFNNMRNFDHMSEEEQAAEEARIEKEAAKLPKDDMRLEIDLCAWVRGYYLTAAMRFTENVSLHLNSGLFPAIQKTVNFHIDKKLGLLDGADRALFEKLMEEESSTAGERERLKGERAKLSSAMETILELERSVGLAHDDEDEDDDIDQYSVGNSVDADLEYRASARMGTLTPSSLLSGVPGRHSDRDTIVTLD